MDSMDGLDWFPEKKNSRDPGTAVITVCQTSCSGKIFFPEKKKKCNVNSNTVLWETLKLKLK